MRHTVLDTTRCASSVSRRQVVSQVGLAAAAGLILGTTSASAQTVTDGDILNFALNLEYLEAEYYLRAVFGRGLSGADTTGSGSPGEVIVKSGSTMVPFTSPLVQQYAREIAADEEAHVRFIRAALTSFGLTPVARPVIDLRDSFTRAARLAKVIGPNASFDPFADENSFLLGAFVFEDLGVTAYKGAARLIENPVVLGAAASIMGVEAYHAGTIRTVLASRQLSAPAQAISNLRDAADGFVARDQGILEDGAINIVPTDRNGIAFGRSAAQVLNIAYLGKASNFGFFPQRLNGTLR